MQKHIELKEHFSRSLREHLKNYYGKVPSASIVAKDFNLRASDIDPISQESARRWIRGVSLPDQDRLRVLIEWLNLDFNQVLRSNHDGSLKIKNIFGNSNSDQLLKAHGDGLSKSEKDLLNLFLNLPEEKRKLVFELLRVLTDE